MGSGIEPRITTAKHLDEKIAALQIGAIDVSDLEFSPRRWLGCGGDLNDVIVVEIEASHCNIRLRFRGFLLDRERAPFAVEFDHAIALRGVDGVAEYGRPAFAAAGLEQMIGNIRP